LQLKEKYVVMSGMQPISCIALFPTLQEAHSMTRVLQCSSVNLLFTA
jgi:hypothetical protein